MNDTVSSSAVIRVRFQHVGFHCWPMAPPHRAYLRDMHRHVFGVTVACSVAHDDREIEFHDLIQSAQELFIVRPAWSCEQAARTLATALCKQYKKTFTVIVSEDGECEAEVQASMR